MLWVQFLLSMAETKKLNMKSRILSFLGIGAITLAVACNSSSDDTTNKDSAAASSETSVDNGTAATATTEAGVLTYSDGRKYVVRTRGGSSASAGTSGSSSTTTSSEYDTVWLYTGSDSRYYTLRGRDTLYYNTDNWNNWWNDAETDNEFKSKNGNTKVKVDDDGSWKVKDANSKTKMDEDGKVKTKPKGQ